jgi:CRISPR-associated protein Cas2
MEEPILISTIIDYLVCIMVLLSYDISDNKKRARFSKYIQKFGHRLQYSVYEIENSSRILDNIIGSIENKFIKEFDETDSVYIFKLTGSCEVKKFGYVSHEDADVIIIK